MEKIAISKFKAKCTAIVATVAQTGQPVTITRHGKAVAEIVPARAQSKEKRVLGGMVGTLEITGDIINTSDLWPADAAERRWDRVERYATAREAAREKERERRRRRKKA